MLHYKKHPEDDHAVCGALLYKGESTTDHNSVQCPVCSVKARAAERKEV